MNRHHPGIKTALIAVALAAGLGSGCGGGDQPAGAAGGALDTYKISPQLAFVPAVTQVASLDVDQMRRLPVYNRAKDAILEAEVRGKWWKSFARALGIDPLADVSRVAVGLQEPVDIYDPMASAVAVFVGKFPDPEGLAQGFLKFAGEKYVLNPPPMQKEDYSGTPIFFASAPSASNTEKTLEFNFAFPSGELMIFSRNRAALLATLEVIAGRSPNLMTSPEWSARLKKVDYGAAVWGAGVFPPALNAYLKEQQAKHSELGGLVHFTTSKEFNAAFSFDSRDYLARLSVVFDEIYKADGMRGDLEKAKANKIMRKVVSHFAGEGTGYVPVWEALFDSALITPEANATNVTIRRSKLDMEEFVKNARNPPASAAPAPEAPSAGSSSPFN